MVEVHNRYVTFHPPAGAKYLVGDFTDWNRRPIPIEKPVTLEFPAGAYVEYAFLDENQQPFPWPIPLPYRARRGKVAPLTFPLAPLPLPHRARRGVF